MKDYSPQKLVSAFVFDLRHPKVADVIKKVRSNHLSYHNENVLRDLAQVAINNEKRYLEGAIVETGCGSGGSAITLAAAKSKDRMLLVYDVFDLHPPPSKEDGSSALQQYELIASGKSPGIGGNLYYGYEKDLCGKVLKSFSDFGFEAKENNILLKKGLYSDTLEIDSPVSMAHIDCDWYDSVLLCLNRIEPHLVRGGTLVLHDYWEGSRKAVKDYFDRVLKSDYVFSRRDALQVVKK